MTASLNFFPVDNGDMCLVELESRHKILIDINIRAVADDPDEDASDVAADLRKRLERDTSGRLFVDAFLLSHPDKDHCTGLKKHFHLGPLEDWSKEADKIVIREIWSSPLVFRRASKNLALCDDAKAFNKEARRRVKLFREDSSLVDDCERILILGEDEDGKTDDLGDILVKVDQVFNKVNGYVENSFVARLIGPLPKHEDEDEEEARAKNRSSTIIQFSLTGNGLADKCRFLTGGDAEVAIWEKVWERHKYHPENLSYDILQAPHHCSWHSLSYDSWSELGDEAEVSADARLALSQARDGALLIASSKAIEDDDIDPPCIGAKREYTQIATSVAGEFVCIGERPNKVKPQVLVVEVGEHGPKLKNSLLAPATVLGASSIGSQPQGHG